MSVALLLITHQTLGGELVRIATGILGTEPPATEAMEVLNDAPCEHLIEEALHRIDRLDQGDGVLVLTDLYGSTPANVAVSLLERRNHLRVIAGVNLPMLLKALNYGALELDAVAAKALQGGRDGVIICALRNEHE